MNKSRWLVSILLIIVIVSIIAGVFVYNRRPKPVPRVTLSLNDFQPVVNSPIVLFSGRVSQDAVVEVRRDTSLLDTVQTHDEFKVEVELVPGRNEISFRARPDGSDDYTTTIATITWEPKTPPVPVIDALPAIVNVPKVKIEGTSYPDAAVRVTVVHKSKEPAPNGSEANNQELPYLQQYSQAGRSGRFETYLRMDEPGEYKVTAAAWNSRGGSSAESSEVKFQYDPEWYPTAGSDQSATSSKRIIRKAKIALAHKQMSLTLEVTLPADDPSVKDLLANKLALDRFFDNIFGLRINETHYVGEFNGVVPQIVIKDQAATITATTAPERTVRDYLPVLEGELTLGGDRGFPFLLADDSLSIHASDYTIQAVTPAPTSLENNTLIWKGTSTGLTDVEQRNLASFKDQIKVQLAYQPLASPRNLFRLTQVSPYDLWKYPGSIIPQFLYGLCSLIPMLWVLWLVTDSRIRTTIDLSLRTDLALLAKTLVTLSLVYTVLDVSWGLGYLGWTLSLSMIVASNDSLLYSISDLALLLLALFCQLITLLGRRRTWGIWLRRIAGGLRNAALICLLLDLSFYFLREWAAYAVIPVLVLTLYLFFSRLAKVLRHGGFFPEYSRRLFLLALIVSLTVLVPLITRDSARSIAVQSFGLLYPLLQCAAAAGLVIVLKTVSSANRQRTRLLVVCVGLILFSGYIVDPSINVFMIPIPFILSILLFRRFVINDWATRTQLDSVNNEIVSDRRGFIDKVLAYETAQHFQANIEKLRDKVTSGDITLKDFEERKLEIEKYAQDKEVASTHKNGLQAKNTVLSIGPNAEDWLNGRWCLKWGAALIAPFLIVYLFLMVFEASGLPASTYGFLVALNQVLVFVADWFIAAFFFGYYFRYLRGSSGLEKGLHVAVVLIVCLLPAWLTRVSSKADLLGIFFRGLQTFLFFILLGIAVFDFATFRNALRGQFRWRTFARFGDMPSLTAVLSVLFASVGVALTTVISGQFKDLITTLISSAFQHTPGPPSP